MHSNLNLSSQLLPLADISCVFINYKFWQVYIMTHGEAAAWCAFLRALLILVFLWVMCSLYSIVLVTSSSKTSVFVCSSISIQTFFFNNSCSIRSSSRSRSICCSSFTLLSILVVLQKHEFKLLSFLDGQPFFFSVFILVIHLFIFPLLGFNFGKTFFIFFAFGK